MVPEDIQNYCPDYASATERQRKAFWVNLIASLSYHESTWRPDVSGGDGRWHGLLQIAPATARGYGCVAGNAADLQVGAMNVSCGIRIMAETVTRDGVISRGMRGVVAMERASGSLSETCVSPVSFMRFSIDLYRAASF